MSRKNIEFLPIEKTLLGEGPHWDASRDTLYFVDVLNSAVQSYHNTTALTCKVKLGPDATIQEGPTFIVPIDQSDNKFVIAHGNKLKTLYWEPNSNSINLSTIYESAEDNNVNGRFNDGKCDASGRLWTGTMPVWNPDPLKQDLGKGILHKLDKDDTVTKEWFGIGLPNGLAWSPDNCTFYLADSYTRRVDAYDYDVLTGKISNQRLAYDYATNQEVGIPDGMTIDINGHLWLASNGNCQVIQIDPNVGKVINRVTFPTSGVTSVTFGGKNLDELYVTSLSYANTHGIFPDEAEAGATFKVTNIGTRGCSPGRLYSKH